MTTRDLEGRTPRRRLPEHSPPPAEVSPVTRYPSAFPGRRPATSGCGTRTPGRANQPQSRRDPRGARARVQRQIRAPGSGNRTGTGGPGLCGNRASRRSSKRGAEDLRAPGSGPVVATEGPAGKEECFSQAPVCEMISESDSHEGHLGLRRIQKTTRGDEVPWESADMERSRTDEAVESGLTA